MGALLEHWRHEYAHGHSATIEKKMPTRSRLLTSLVSVRQRLSSLTRLAFCIPTRSPSESDLLENTSRRPTTMSIPSFHGGLVDGALAEAVIAATGDKADSRLKEIMPSLVRHLHDFAREVDLTVEEWALGVEFINRCGQMSDDCRNETQLLCDVLGLESLVDEFTTRKHQQTQMYSDLKATPSTVLGPFYRHNAPTLPRAASIVSPELRETYKPNTTRLTGSVLDSTGNAIPGAMLDIWHADPEGKYEQQDRIGHADMDLRGRFATDARGSYALTCLRPVSYPIPDDGPVGELLGRLGRHPYRPAHIHFIVSAPGYRTLTTQIFDSDDQWLVDDSVFAVKEALIVDFVPVQDEEASYKASFDFVLTRDHNADHSAPVERGMKL